MNKQLMKFWITCPKCKQKFGVKPEIVIKYMDRLFGELESRIQKKGQELQQRKNQQEQE